MLWWISQCCLSDNTSLSFWARPGSTGSESRTSATEVWLASSRVCGIRTGWMSPVATQYGGGGREGGREVERIQKFYDSIHHPYWPSSACSRLRCLHLVSGFSLPRPCYDAGWKSLLYLCHLRLSHCHHATLWLLFCGGTKLLQPRLQHCSLSLAPFRIITDWLLTSPPPQRIYKFITQLIPSDTLLPLKVLRNQSHWKCTLWTWKMSSKIAGWTNGATGDISV